ncbi:hypothetical protein ACFVT5_19075 [Streptomyces sp. NPDC058001]|uniref:hypothetical protein n=1 Tax=Streptomyces sp. NPDC058001 TaxID=3346300 RepID=UPI0036E16BC0
MAKQRITVCLPPVGPDGLKQAIGRAMAPFRYDREDVPHPDWVGEWDYWFVSGAGCLFDVRPGHEDDPRLVRHDDWTESAEDLPPSRCHGGPRGLLDLDTPRAAEARRAAGTWTAYHAFADRHPPALPFHHFEERARTLEPEHVREAAVAAFREQPLIQAIEADPALEERFTSDPALHLDEDQDTYVSRHVAAVLPTPALLTLDGRWVEGGGPDYQRTFNTYLDALPGDAMAVRVLYHS